jgi:hypothetical protein
MWVAVGTDSTANNTIKYSYDGITWFNSTGSGFTTQGFGVAWNGLMWVAVGQDSTANNTIKYSYDGITWSNSSGPGFTTQGHGISWNGRMWIAVGQDSTANNTIKYSYNGINWFNSSSGGFSSHGRGIANNSQQIPDIATQRLNIYSQNVPVYQSSINQILALESSIVLNNTLYVNKETDRVGINVANPASVLSIAGRNNADSILNIYQNNGYPNMTINGPSTTMELLTNESISPYQAILRAGGNANARLDIENPGNYPRITILKNGNVGINNTNPQYTLDVNGTLNVVGIVQNSNGYFSGINESEYIGLNTPNRPIAVTAQGTGMYIFRPGNNDSRININTRNAGVLLSSFTVSQLGFVGINNPNPQYTLDVNGDIGLSNQSQTALMIFKTLAGASYIQSGSNGTVGSANKLYFTSIASSAQVMTLDHVNGRVGINNKTSPAYTLDVSGAIYASGDITAGSDMRFKTLINTIENPLSTLKELRGVTYHLKNLSTSTRKIGVIAQEVEKVLPEVVSTDDSPDQFKSVAYGNISALLIEAIKELSGQLEILKTRVDDLTDKINRI